MTKKQQPIHLFKERVQLLKKSIKEKDDGTFVPEITPLGMVWMRIQTVDSQEVEKLCEQPSLTTCKPRCVYKIVMQKYFSSDSRHAIINALSWNDKVLDLIRLLGMSEDGYYFEGMAADFGEETYHG